MIALIRIAAVASMIFLPGQVFAQIYKWVDEKGGVHYGEKPPAGKGQEVTRPDATGGATREADPVRDKRALEQQEREFQRRQQARERELEAERRAQQKRNTPAAERARLAECRRATRDLEVIRANPTSHTYAEEAQVKDRVARNCP